MVIKSVPKLYILKLLNTVPVFNVRVCVHTVYHGSAAIPLATNYK
jgi:hypothetical protein